MQTFQTRDEMVRALVKPGSVVAEIGVFEGTFSKILHATRPSCLFLVDPWMGTVQSGDADGNNVRTVFLPDASMDVQRMFDTCPAVKLVRSTSSDFFRSLPDASLDCVYLDGDHSYEGVRADLEAAIRVLRPGGVLAGHDYEINPRKALYNYEFGVKKAVDEFCEAHGVSLAAKAMDGMMTETESGAKKCVFFVAGGDAGYAALLDLCVSSIRRFHPPATLDIMVMCDSGFAKGITQTTVHIIETPAMSGPALNTSMMKVWLPDYLRQFDKVLFLDCDIVICGSLEPLFRTICEDGVLYTCEEGGPSNHQQLYWSLLAHTQDELEELERGNVGVFNCGQFGFVPGDATMEHFANIRKLMETHEGPYFVEQSFMNHYFARHPQCTKPTLTPFVKLEARTYEPDAVVAHFTGACMCWVEKLQLMQAWHAEIPPPTTAA